MSAIATCPWCNQPKALDETSKWKRHMRLLAWAERVHLRGAPTKKHCEGSGALHLTQKQADRIHGGESSRAVLGRDEL